MAISDGFRGRAIAAPRHQGKNNIKKCLYCYVHKFRRRRPSRQGREIVEEAGDAADIPLIHDELGAPGRLAEIERADALLDAREGRRRHREIADAEAEEESRVARIARHLAAEAK